MADHVRQQIRAATADALSGATVAGANVFKGHVYPKHLLPCLSVLTPEDEYTEEASSMGSDAFACNLVVEVCAAANADLDDLVDRLCAEVHQVLMASTTLKNLLVNLQLMGTGPIELEDEGEHPHGRARMNWVGLYSIDPGDPTSTA